MSEPQLPIPALLPDTENFWRACHDGRLELNRCQACRWYIHPSRPVCSRCQSREVKPEQLSGKGVVFSYTINYQPWIPNMACSGIGPAPSNVFASAMVAAIGVESVLLICMLSRAPIS